MQKDNTTLFLKINLRRALLAEIAQPVVLETHGGMGVIYEHCYADVQAGLVLEKDELKTAHLARQRPTWAVYQCDCVAALQGGIGAHLPLNFFDLDPYGEPWPVLEALFTSERPWPKRIGIAVNDGLRRNMRFGLGWHTASMQEMVGKYGNRALFDNYLAVCREVLCGIASQRGYKLTRWQGYYCGLKEQITHYSAVLEH